MSGRKRSTLFPVVMLLGLGLATSASWSQAQNPKPPHDAVLDAQTPHDVQRTRPEQQKNDHDLSDVFKAIKAEPSSSAFTNQPDQGQVLGFDFYRDPLN